MSLLGRRLRSLQRLLPPLNFISVHYAYFITTCLVSAVILWGASTPARSVSFTDALFLAVSAMTLAGLNTVLLRKARFEKKFRDVIAEQRRKAERRRGRSRSRSHKRAWSLSRRRSFPDPPILVGDPEKGKENNASEVVVDEKENPPAASPERQHTPLTNVAVADDQAEEAVVDTTLPSLSTGIKFRDDTVFKHRHQDMPPFSRHGSRRLDRPPLSRRGSRASVFSAQGVGARTTASLKSRSPSRANVGPAADTASEHMVSHGDISRYFPTIGGWISRNSQFHGLTDAERERLGGYEYRAVKVLSWLVPAYFISWQLLACLGCAAWVAMNRPETTLSNGLNPWWVGAFNAVSAFNNSGMSLLDANMTAFQTAYYLLITMSLLILAGNTCYPVFLRLIVWTMYKIVQRLESRSEQWEERARTLEFLLAHPRRCYTNLFPSRHTWWLLLSVATLNGIDWAAFEILNIGNKAIEALPDGVRSIDGLFQAFAVRSGGFYVVPLSEVRVGLQVLYVVMMYISVYPVVITMRNSNVYEERSLGIYAEDEDDYRHQQESNHGFFRRVSGHLIAGGDANSTFLRQQLRAQLAHDAWTIVLALFLIVIIETSQFARDASNFSVFNFLFEIVSAYGCVGISIGIPWADYSFCGTWHTLSKLILCAVMLKGRHRGLPVAIDRAVLLPGEENEQAEEDDGRIRLARSMSRARPVDTASLLTV